MTSDRPYRRGMSGEEAVGELRRGSGSQFDPAVVEAFVVGIAEQDRPTRSPRQRPTWRFAVTVAQPSAESSGRSRLEALRLGL